MDTPLISIAIDWLQLHTRFKSDVSRWNLDVYDVKRRQFGTQFFEDVEYIFRRGRLLATACSKPRSAIISPDTCIVKFENDVLYDINLDWQVKEFLGYNKLQFIGITRMDIAADFNEFHNGLQAESLMQKFYAGKIVKLGRGKGSSNFYVGRKLQLETLKFAGKDSPISVYLYNKTKELIQRKMKPWIVAQWDKVGVNSKKDVWRLEVSIKGARKELLNAKTGEKFNFYSLEIIKEDNVQLLWAALVEKYFTFAYERRSETNKSRLAKIELFKNIDFHGVVIERTDKVESNKMDKYFINKLTKTFQELQGTADDIAENTLQLQGWYIHSRDIERQKKLATEKIKSGNPNADKFIVADVPDVIPDAAIPIEKWNDEFNFNE